MRTHRRQHTKTAAWPQAVAVLVGVLFVIIGVIGFAATGLDGFASRGDPDRLFWLALNPLQNLVHLAVGAAGIVLSARLDRARIFGWALTVALGSLFGYGVLVSRVREADVLNLNWPDNWLHLAFALVGVVIATGPARARPLPAPRAARPQAGEPSQAAERSQAD
jgi:hypothetical protein